jgi:hypothetical protein
MLFKRQKEGRYIEAITAAHERLALLEGASDPDRGFLNQFGGLNV